MRRNGDAYESEYEKGDEKKAAAHKNSESISRRTYEEAARYRSASSSMKMALLRSLFLVLALLLYLNRIHIRACDRLFSFHRNCLRERNSLFTISGDSDARWGLEATHVYLVAFCRKRRNVDFYLMRD